MVEDFWQQYHAVNLRGMMDLQLQRQEELICRLIEQLASQNLQAQGLPPATSVLPEWTSRADSRSSSMGAQEANVASSARGMHCNPGAQHAGFDHQRAPPHHLLEESEFVIQTDPAGAMSPGLLSGSSTPRGRRRSGGSDISLPGVKPRHRGSGGSPPKPAAMSKSVGGQAVRRVKSMSVHGDAPEQPNLIDTMLPGNDWSSRTLRNTLGAVLRFVTWFRNLTEPPRSGCIANLVLSRKFELTCGFVIVCNSAFTISTTNYAMETLQDKLTPTQAGFELGFCVFYVIELLLKISVHRQYFFCNEDWRWAYLDTFLVLMAVQDQAILYMDTGDKGANLNFMRSLRIMKITRIFRMLRVIKVFNELRNLLMTIIGSFVSLFWCLVMLSFILLLFGMIFVQVVSDYLILQKDAGTMDEDLRDEMKDIFGSVFTAMATLYMATTGGDDWRNFYDALGQTGSMNALIFIFFISFFNFAVFNVLTGIFVENAMKVSKEDRDMLVVEQRRKEMFDTESLRRLCHQMDEDASGTITWSEFEEALNKGTVSTHLAAIGLDVHDAEMFFEMLASISGSDEVNIDDFVLGCMRMKGGATSIDMQMLAYQARLLQRGQGALEVDQKKLLELMVYMCRDNMYLGGGSYQTSLSCTPSVSRTGTINDMKGMLSRSRSVTQDLSVAAPVPARGGLPRSQSGNVRFSDDDQLVLEGALLPCPKPRMPSKDVDAVQGTLRRPPEDAAPAAPEIIGVLGLQVEATPLGLWPGRRRPGPPREVPAPQAAMHEL